MCRNWQDNLFLNIINHTHVDAIFVKSSTLLLLDYKRGIKSLTDIVLLQSNVLLNSILSSYSFFLLDPKKFDHLRLARQFLFLLSIV